MIATELRIGNFVLYEGKQLEIYEFNNSLNLIEFKISSCGTMSPGINNCHIQPIELTEEILLKCGLEKSTHIIVNANDERYEGAVNYVTKGDNYYMNIYVNNGLFYYYLDCNDDDYGFNYTMKEIKFLHQLQNVAFIIDEVTVIYDPK
jgi:hypothetical protein